MINHGVRGVVLRVPSPSDVERMWREESRADRAAHWRLGGTTASLEEFRSMIWTNALHQWLVVDRVSDDPLGVVLSYDYNPWDGHCKVGVCSYSASGVAVFYGLAIALDQIFGSVPVRKVYFEIPDVNDSRFERVLLRLCEHEGIIPDYRFAGGRWVSVGLWSLSRERWLSPNNVRIRRLLGHERS
jgi:RimJ/RimL family protein N-acetyltransferase